MTMNAEARRYIDRLFERQARRLRNIVARGVVVMVDDARKMQEQQVRLLDGELIDGAERPQPYGFSSNPQPGAECFAAFVGAGREHPVILAVDDRRFRVRSLQPGEVCIYTDEGDSITLKRGKRIEVKTGHAVVEAEDSCAVVSKNCSVRCDTCEVSAKVSASIAAPVIKLAGALSVSGAGGGAGTAILEGDLVVSGDVSASGVSLVRHTHNYSSEGGVTNPPNG
ncbi:MAG: phage baseplate assembly protein V [Desulfovibrionaceae bacterium]|nr:phage baseplate assembly protein V [Desulfovibrionaceae bacterium]